LAKLLSDGVFDGELQRVLPDPEFLWYPHPIGDEIISPPVTADFGLDREYMVGHSLSTGSNNLVATLEFGFVLAGRFQDFG
jgi:hypothetical protein